MATASKQSHSWPPTGKVNPSNRSSRTATALHLQTGHQQSWVSGAQGWCRCCWIVLLHVCVGSLQNPEYGRMFWCCDIFSLHLELSIQVVNVCSSVIQNRRAVERLNLIILTPFVLARFGGKKYQCGYAGCLGTVLGKDCTSQSAGRLIHSSGKQTSSRKATSGDRRFKCRCSLLLCKPAGRRQWDGF